MTEYAQINNNLVTWVIVADANHIATRTDGPWVLTPSHVEIGYSYQNGIFLSPLPSSMSLVGGDILALVTTVVAYSDYTYQWQKDGVDMAGEVRCSYVVGNVSSGDAATYTCNVTCGVTTASTSIVVTVS